MDSDIVQDSPLSAVLEANRRYAEGRHDPATPAPPRLRLTVVTCMDARIVALEALGLRPGDAHILRNAGGRVCGDVLRSLAVSCGVYGTTDVAVIHHTDCGMQQPEDAVHQRILEATGRPDGELDLLMIRDGPADLADDVRRVRESHLVPDTVRVWGLRYDVTTGRLSLEVTP